MTSNGDDQRRCNCKRSKCLKLYCDCFAAGYYCDETCSCQECFNRLDYEDTVEEARRQIELRNPLAFSPKIHCLTQSSTSQIVEDGEQLPTPIAGKHKKGCNCKKSMCTKRYCECYQAKVGCSSDCRCEGCQNVFGKREGYNESTPWTAFQHTRYKDDTSTSTCSQFNGCYVPSPGSANSEIILGTSNENVEPMNQFTPLDTTQFNDIYPFMDWSNGSRANESFSSVNSLQWPGLLNRVNPVPRTFGGPIVNEFNGNPIETIHENTINLWSESYIHPNTGRVSSRGAM